LPIAGIVDEAVTGSMNQMQSCRNLSSHRAAVLEIKVQISALLELMGRDCWKLGLRLLELVGRQQKGQQLGTPTRIHQPSSPHRSFRIMPIM
jgi:hypothetical protein